MTPDQFWLTAIKLRFNHTDGEFILWCDSCDYHHEHAANVIYIVQARLLNIYPKTTIQDVVTSCESVYNQHHDKKQNAL